MKAAFEDFAKSSKDIETELELEIDAVSTLHVTRTALPAPQLDPPPRLLPARGLQLKLKIEESDSIIQLQKNELASRPGVPHQAHRDVVLATMAAMSCAIEEGDAEIRKLHSSLASLAKALDAADAISAAQREEVLALQARLDARAASLAVEPAGVESDKVIHALKTQLAAAEAALSQQRASTQSAVDTGGGGGSKSPREAQLLESLADAAAVPGVDRASAAIPVGNEHAIAALEAADRLLSAAAVASTRAAADSAAGDQGGGEHRSGTTAVAALSSRRASASDGVLAKALVQQVLQALRAGEANAASSLGDPVELSSLALTLQPTVTSPPAQPHLHTLLRSPQKQMSPAGGSAGAAAAASLQPTDASTAAARFDSLQRQNAHLLSKLFKAHNSINVYCRVRPPTREELQRFRSSGGSGSQAQLLGRTSGAPVAPERVVVDALSDTELAFFDAAAKTWRPFAFDRVFAPSEGQEDVFRDVAPLAQAVVEGYNACILAYGITGAKRAELDV
jgi:hypothetical protein